MSRENALTYDAADNAAKSYDLAVKTPCRTNWKAFTRCRSEVHASYRAELPGDLAAAAKGGQLWLLPPYGIKQANG